MSKHIVIAIVAVVLVVGWGVADAQTSYQNAKPKGELSAVTVGCRVSADCVVLLRLKLVLRGGSGDLRTFVDTTGDDELKEETVSQRAARKVMAALTVWWAFQTVSSEADFIRLRKEADRVAVQALKGAVPKGTRGDIQLLFILRPEVRRQGEVET